MQATVLGATGFIGGHIARAAVARGWHVRAVRRRPGAVGAIGDLPVEWVEANLSDESSLFRAMCDSEIVFHAAASYPQDFRRIPLVVAQATEEMTCVLRAAQRANVRRIVYTSSLTTLGLAGPGRFADESMFYTPGLARSAYFEAKHVMEQIALRASAPQDVVVLLPSAVFGPGDVKPTTGVVIRDAARGRFPFYFDALINVVDVRDVAWTHLAAAERGRRGERYIVGGHNLTLYELLATVAAITGRQPPRFKLSRRLIRALVYLSDHLPGPGLPENFRTFEFWQPVSSHKAQQELGHTIRPFEETVRDTLVWFQEHQLVAGGA
ncbi:MAG: NAD-dependent epimerase/dehydratase family protein [Anaerolineae bacterium]|nr:NAD-dependent epimerase/dehydratase family protein [Thermoflexales bacterium]MDW8408402.1 NAD-dependent epimerase/dehydratase family protein [Anaerolineae bacterium]